MSPKRKAKRRPPASSRAGRSLYTSKLSSWFTDATNKRARSETQARLQEGAKLVRQLYSGFSAEDGYDVRRIRHWPDARVKELQSFIAQARRLTSGEYHEFYTLHRPRTPDQRSALILHSGLTSPDETKHPQRAWPIYANTKKVKIRYIKERVPTGFAMGRPLYIERLRAEVRRPVGDKGSVLVHRDYLFREVLGFQPGIDSTTPEGLRVGRILKTMDPWAQMRAAMRLLLPYLPDYTPRGDEAHYRLLSDRGPVGTSVPKHMLMDRMDTWAEEYGDADGFVGMLIGVRYVGDEFAAISGPKSVDKTAQQRKARYQEYTRSRGKARSRIQGATGRLHPIAKKKRKSVPKKKTAKKRKLKRGVKHK